MKKVKKAQIKLSFGMIFSIILIVIFIAFAFYGIKVFLDLKNEVQVEQFRNDLQNDVDKLWAGSQGSREVSYLLPKKIEGICFVDDEFYNLEFKIEDLRIKEETIEHVDILKTLEERESLCIPNIEGRISFVLEKNFGENFVTIKRKNE